MISCSRVTRAVEMLAGIGIDITRVGKTIATNVRLYWLFLSRSTSQTQESVVIVERQDEEEKSTWSLPPPTFIL